MLLCPDLMEVGITDSKSSNKKRLPKQILKMLKESSK